MSDSYEINGVNISKILKNKRIQNGSIKLDKLKQRYNANIIENKNNTVLIEINGDLFYYGLISNKIRLKGDKVWTSKVITFLNNHFDNKKRLSNEL